MSLCKDFSNVFLQSKIHSTTITKSVLFVSLTTATTFLFWLRLVSKEKYVPFHVDYQHGEFPFIMKILANYIPRFLQVRLAIAGGDPKLPKDGIEVLQDDDYNPYSVVEIEKNTIWKVKYEGIVEANKKMKGIMKSLGVDTENVLNFISQEEDPDIYNLLKSDLAIAEKADSLDQKSLIQQRHTRIFNMYVIKLKDSSLLLYNPVRCHPFLLHWLQRLGKVKYIISGSSSHTNFMPHAASTFPNAEIICADFANLKCIKVGMRPATYCYTNENDYAKLSQELRSFDIELCYIKGDIFTHALCLIYQKKFLFTVDLLYGSECQNKPSWLMNDKSWHHPCVDGACSLYNLRLFYYAFRHTSPNKCLPLYRFMAMDPDNPLAKLNFESPKKDGSSCREMANAFRKLFQMKFELQLDVHSDDDESMSREKFEKVIEANWGWLDGASLLNLSQGDIVV